MPSGISKTPRLTALRKSKAQKCLWRNKEERAKRLAGLRSATRTPEFRAKMSEINGTRMRQPKERKSMSRVMKHRHKTNPVYHAQAVKELRKAHVELCRKGFSATHRLNMSRARKGKKMRGVRSKAYRQKIGANSKRRWAEFKASGRAKLVAEKISRSIKHLIATDPVYRKSTLEAALKGMRITGALRPNRTELKLEAILNKHFPGEFKLNVSGEVTIGGKIPDFVNVNGRKCLVEYFGKLWHPPEDESIRKKCFRKYGFATAVIWGDEIRDEDLVVSKVRKVIETC